MDDTNMDAGGNTPAGALLPGPMPLTREKILRAVDVSCRQARGLYMDFEDWIKENLPDLLWGTIISFSPRTMFWQGWLCHKPDVQEWLIENGFAVWEQVSEPEPESAPAPTQFRYSVDGRPGTRQVIITRGLFPDTVDIMIGGYLVMTLPDGEYRRHNDGISTVAKVDNTGRIQERARVPDTIITNIAEPGYERGAAPKLPYLHPSSCRIGQHPSGRFFRLRRLAPQLPDWHIPQLREVRYYLQDGRLREEYWSLPIWPNEAGVGAPPWPAEQEDE